MFLTVFSSTGPDHSLHFDSSAVASGSITLVWVLVQSLVDKLRNTEITLIRWLDGLGVVLLGTFCLTLGMCACFSCFFFFFYFFAQQWNPRVVSMQVIVTDPSLPVGTE